MQVRVDAGEVVGAVAHLEAAADSARRLAAVAGRLSGDVTTAALAGSLRLLGDVCGDVLEVGGLALDLIAAKARAGADCYDRVEESVVRSSGAEARHR